MLNFKIIFRSYGYALLIEGGFMLLSLLVALVYNEPDSLAFLEASLITLGAGAIFWLLFRKANRQVGKHEGYILVATLWFLLSFFGSLPFLISKTIPTYTSAFFETVSGFTTTGVTVFPNVEVLAHGILFWRSLIQWIGGIVVLTIFIAVLPALGITGISVYSTETPGVAAGKLNPRIKDTALHLLNVYLIFTASEAFLLTLGGMGFFDAICHSFTTISTGGFSTKQMGISYWGSPYVHYIVIFFMFLAGTNFSLSFYTFTGSPKKMFRNEEFISYLKILGIFTAVFTVGLMLTSSEGFEKAFRHSLFQVTSVISTTGFCISDYTEWHPFLSTLIFLLFFIGASSGSAGGGIKVMRVVLLVKNSYYELRRLIHPNAVLPVRYNQRSVADQTITNVLLFFFFYIAAFFFGTLIFMFFVDDFYTSVGAVASCLANIGPGFGSVAPFANYAHIPALGKWFLSLLMILGRVEIFSFLIILYPLFWKK